MVAQACLAAPTELEAGSLVHFQEPAVKGIRLLPNHANPTRVRVERIQQHIRRVRQDCGRHFE